ncbi:MAG: hypothetical protein COY82_00570 [Parcubacteria group bacterium CG_4_10_14_0_8_um_filter_35_7]|nr:MAG: hypothetical protein COY82_00570 [Parcubacteria group bacterium CG_4_10_14_0_8_um_filter_35_7]
MTLKSYLILMTISTFFCWLAWGVVLFFIDPTQAGFIGLLFFYLSLFLALTGTISLIGFFLRTLILKNEIVFRHVIISFRQAVFFSMVIVGSLFLESKDLFTWWNITFLVLFLTVLEFFFISQRRRS